MSGTGGTCEYELDPENPGSWNDGDANECYLPDSSLNSDGVWSCPYETVEGHSRCLFHLPLSQKDDDVVLDAFLRQIESPRGDVLDFDSDHEFIGAKFGKFELPEEVVLGSEHRDTQFNFQHATFHGPVDFSDAKLLGQTRFGGAKFTSKAIFTDAIFEDDADLNGAKFSQTADFDGAKFGGRAMFGSKYATFADTTFEGIATFEGTEFSDEANFQGVHFPYWAIFSEAEFLDDVSFAGATFHDLTKFVDATFHGEVQMRKIESRQSAYFRDATFRGEVTIRESLFENIQFDSARFHGDLDVRSVQFEDVLSFQNASFGGQVAFAGIDFRGSTDFRDTRFEQGGNFAELDLTDVNWSGADLRCVNFEDSRLSRANLVRADLRGARLSNAMLGDVRIDERTLFLGHHSDTRNRTLHFSSATFSKATCVYDPAYGESNSPPDSDKAKGVYRALEELASRAARPGLQAKCFVRRQDLQKQSYWEHAADENLPFRDRITAGGRWIRARTAEIVLLYGESPWRIIGYCLGMILMFGLLLPAGGWIATANPRTPVTYTRIIEDPILLWKSIYHSAMLFATGNNYGGVTATTFPGEVLTTLEALLGPTMLALLVFVLGRRAAR